MNLIKLQSEINHQTRNGRTSIYLPVSTIKQLDNTFESENEFEYIEESRLQNMINNYRKNSFRESLRVDVDNNISVKPKVVKKNVEDREI